MKPRHIDMRCSFCGKTKDKVGKLIAGPGVFICDQCVALCNEIISQPPPPTTQVKPPMGDWVSSTSIKGSWWRRFFRIEAFEPA